MQIEQKLTIPKDARLFFCTDVHGEFDALQSVLNQAGYNEEVDYLISCGDLIDRGPDNAKTLVYFFNKFNRYAILGNHEHMFLGGNYDHIMNGGGWTFTLDEDSLSLLRNKITENFPLVLTLHVQGICPSTGLGTLTKIGCVHAEIPMGYDSYEDFLDDLPRSNRAQASAIWGRDMINKSKHITDVDFVLHGHTSIPEPMQVKNRLYFDTGRWGPQAGKLTLLEFVEGEFKQYTSEFELKKPRMHP